MNRIQKATFRGGRITSLSAVLLAAAALVVPRDGMAAPALPDQIVTLTDEGSSATVNLDSTAGMNNWSVNGQNQLNQQWFWYRIGNSGVAQPINTISRASYTSPSANEVIATYANAQLSLSIDYFLQGGGVGSGSADITESISAVNTSGAGLNFHFFQYSDFNLLGDGSSDNVQLFGGPGSYSYVRQWTGSTGIGEAIVYPYANHGEAELVGTTLAKLNGTSGLQLSDDQTAGPGDVTWALQWDTDIAIGDMFDLTKDKSLVIQVIPEPSALALILLGMGACGVARRRQTS
jgi:hypothetical protein